jgi:hypothetical protein
VTPRAIVPGSSSAQKNPQRIELLLLVVIPAEERVKELLKPVNEGCIDVVRASRRALQALPSMRYTFDGI